MYRRGSVGLRRIAFSTSAIVSSGGPLLLSKWWLRTPCAAPKLPLSFIASSNSAVARSGIDLGFVEPGRLLDRKIAGLGTVEDFPRVNAEQAKHAREARRN